MKLKTLLREAVGKEMNLSPNWGTKPYGQAVSGAAIDAWEKLIAVLNSYDITAQFSDDNRALQDRNGVDRDIRDFLRSYSGPEDWSKLTSLGRDARKKLGI